MSTESPFPSAFLWGAATSAYQIEGASQRDGAGPSIWDRYVNTPGRVHNGDSGETSCDHYHRYEEDVAIMRKLGLNAYRFSISWSRVLPEGRGVQNKKGIGFYDQLVDQLCEASITPVATLYHWDLPASLHDVGGWLNPDVANAFADYAELMFNALGDRVQHWTTINEPWVVAHVGHLTGDLAPGHEDPYEAVRVGHNLLLAHGLATRRFRKANRGEIGLVVNLEPKYPDSDSSADAHALKLSDAYINRYYLDPVFHGRYPEELKTIFREAWHEPPSSDFEIIQEPIDFLGVNYYSRRVIAHDSSRKYVPAKEVHQPNSTYTEMGWEVYPDGLVRTLEWVKDEYGDLPLYITENGAAFYDPPTPQNGTIHDPLRVAYLRDHLHAVKTALSKGVDLRGYFVWSLLDNFEWGYGYSKRFGIVHVDFESKKRTIKDSAKYYKSVIDSRGSDLNGTSY